MREIKYLYNNKDFFISHISLFLQWTPEQLKKHKEVLIWEYLSHNMKLDWTGQLLEDFRDFWNWNNLSGNESLPWTDDLIISFSDKWNFEIRSDQSVGCILYNGSVTWSKKLVYIFRDKITGDWLAQQTELLNNHPEMLEEFKEELWREYISGNENMNWSEDLIEKFTDRWDWDALSANEAIVWTNELKAKYSDRFNNYNHERHYRGEYANIRRKPEDDLPDTDENPVILYTPDEFEKRRKLSRPGYMSLDNRVPWSDELIAKWEPEWDWEYLSFNRDLPWSESLIDRFLNRWDFGTILNIPPYGECRTCGLSSNPALPWSRNLLRKYESRWDWVVLSSSEFLPWSIEILKDFERLWDQKRLIYNEAMWEKVFQPCLDGDIICELLTYINEKEECPF